MIGHSDLVTAVKFFPRASHLDQVIVSGAVDKSIRLWKLSKASVELVAVPEAHASTVTCLAVCPGTDVLVTGSASAIFKVWRVEWAEESAQVLNLQTVHLEPRLFPLTLALHRLPGSDDDLILAVAGTKNTVQVYVAGKHGDFVHQATLVGHEGWVNFVAISKQANRNSDGLLLASASQDKYIRLWRITRHEVKQEDELSIEAYEESLSNRRHELRGCKSNYLLTFEALLLGHEDWIHTVSWCLDNDHLRLLSASADNSIAIWEPERNSGIWLPTTRLGEISAQKGSTTATGSTGGFWIGLWSGNGESIVSLGRTGSWRIWNWNPSQDRWVQGVGISGHTKTIPDIAWAKGGAYIISVSTDQTARLHAPWNTGLRPSWHEMARPQIHGYDLSCIDSLAQSYFVSGADEKLLRVFEESRGTAQLLGRLCGIKEPVGKTLPLTARIPALGLSNKAIDAEDLETVADEGFGTQSLAPRASSNDGDGTAQSPPTEDDLARRTLWPEQEKLYGHGYEISAVAASYGGSIVATACKASSLEHAVIRIYSTDDWREVKPSLKAHSLTVTGLAFSKDDRYLLSVGRDRQWALFARSIDGTLSYSVAHADSKGHTRMILDACWAPLEAGYTFATAGRDKVVKIWCLRSQGAENVATLATPSSATSVDIAPRLVDDELLLAVGTESSEVEIYAIGMIRWDARMRSEGKDMWVYWCWTITVTVTNWRARSWASRAITRVRWRPQLGSGSLELAIASEDSSLRLVSISGNIKWAGNAGKESRCDLPVRRRSTQLNKEAIHKLYLSWWSGESLWTIVVIFIFVDFPVVRGFTPRAGKAAHGATAVRGAAGWPMRDPLKRHVQPPNLSFLALRFTTLNLTRIIILYANEANRQLDRSVLKEIFLSLLQQPRSTVQKHL